MQANVKTRYVLAVYLFVFSLSIILLLSAITIAKPESIFQSVLLGLTTEILGVVLIFLVINRLFLLEDWNVSERVSALLEKLELGVVEEKVDYLAEQQQQIYRGLQDLHASGLKFETRSALKPFHLAIADAREINIFGHHLSSISNSSAGAMLKKANKGCKFRIIILDPTNDTVLNAAAQLSDRSGNAGSRHLQSDINRSLEILKPLSESGNAEIRLTGVMMPFTMILLDPSQTSGTAQIEFCAYRTNRTDLLHVKLTPHSNRDSYAFFLDQFEKLWNDSTRIHTLNNTEQ